MPRIVVSIAMPRDEHCDTPIAVYYMSDCARWRSTDFATQKIVEGLFTFSEYLAQQQDENVTMQLDDFSAAAQKIEAGYRFMSFLHGTSFSDVRAAFSTFAQGLVNASLFASGPGRLCHVGKPEQAWEMRQADFYASYCGQPTQQHHLLSALASAGHRFPRVVWERLAREMLPLTDVMLHELYFLLKHKTAHAQQRFVANASVLRHHVDAEESCPLSQYQNMLDGSGLQLKYDQVNFTQHNPEHASYSDDCQALFPCHVLLTLKHIQFTCVGNGERFVQSMCFFSDILLKMMLSLSVRSLKQPHPGYLALFTFTLDVLSHWLEMRDTKKMPTEMFDLFVPFLQGSQGLYVSEIDYLRRWHCDHVTTLPALLLAPGENTNKQASKLMLSYLGEHVDAQIKKHLPCFRPTETGSMLEPLYNQFHAFSNSNSLWCEFWSDKLKPIGLSVLIQVAKEHDSGSVNHDLLNCMSELVVCCIAGKPLINTIEWPSEVRVFAERYWYQYAALADSIPKSPGHADAISGDAEQVMSLPLQQLKLPPPDTPSFNTIDDFVQSHQQEINSANDPVHAIYLLCLSLPELLQRPFVDACANPLGGMVEFSRQSVVQFLDPSLRCENKQQYLCLLLRYYLVRARDDRPYHGCWAGANNSREAKLTAAWQAFSGTLPAAEPPALLERGSLLGRVYAMRPSVD